MDGARFDRVTRGLAGATTRRGVLRGAIAGLLGGAALAEGADAAPSRRTVCRGISASCTRGSQCCTGFCQTSRSAARSERNRCGCQWGPACNGICCGEGEVCLDGACAVPPLTCDVFRASGEACEIHGECCSLSCVDGVCENPSFDCSTFTSPDFFEACIRLVGQKVGSVLRVPADLVCGVNSSYGSCQSDEDCKALNQDAPKVGRCINQFYIDIGGGNNLDLAGGVGSCFYIYPPDQC